MTLALLWLLSPSLVEAEAGITVTASDVNADFPSRIEFTVDAESYAGMLNAGNPSARMSTGCLNPELAYAIAKACKNGMKMDDIFEKVKTIQWPERSPCHPTATMAKFVRDVLGMNLTDVFGKEDADRYESWIAEEASAQ
jgi:hypothetical protein